MMAERFFRSWKNMDYTQVKHEKYPLFLFHWYFTLQCTAVQFNQSFLPGGQMAVSLKKIK